MAYIICEPCIGTKDTAASMCAPWTAFIPVRMRPGLGDAEMLYLHPHECIDCACVPACPAEAAFALDETPARWKAYVGRNARYYS